MRLQRRMGWLGLVVSASAMAASAGTGAAGASTASTAGAVPTAPGLSAAPATAASAVSPITVPARDAQAVFNGMSEAQRIGQLFMVGATATGVSSSTWTAISKYHVGNVILTGRSAAGVSATRSVTNSLQAHTTFSATSGVPLFVATDQEGGEVQVLSGPGFSTIPQALNQGTWSTSTLQTQARTWGGQLMAAGVNLDLAPVMDTVPTGQVNPPIGYYNREYGHTTAVVGPHGTAFAEGMARAGVTVTVKHFPGLGRVAANTDTAAGVTDHVTTYNDAYLTPFKSAIQAGAPFAMMSLAYYHNIDPTHPAAFSSTIIGGMLRGEMGFKGVVISDDLGSAQQVAAWSPGARAIHFINAGGDMVLSVAASVIPAMVDAVSTEAATSSSFRAKINTAALLVLRAKQAQGLITGGDVAGDFNGNGRTEVAIWRPSTGTWYIPGVETVRWGQAGDVPVAGDFNGDGRTEVAVWRPSTGAWYVRGVETVRWGQAGDVPVLGDFNGDGRTEVAVWRPYTGTWYVRGVERMPWGRLGDVPVLGDFNGDGRTDVAVWRPASGMWYVHGQFDMQYGARGDVPV